MFKEFAGEMVEPLNITKWNPISVQTMDYMFESANITGKITINNWNLSNLKSSGNSFMSYCNASEVEMDGIRMNPEIASSRVFDFKFMKKLSSLKFTNVTLNLDLDSDFLYDNPALVVVDIRGTKTQDNILTNIAEGTFGVIKVDDTYNESVHVHNGWLLMKGTYIDYSNVILNQAKVINVINQLEEKSNATIKLGNNIYLLTPEQIQGAVSKGWSVIQ